MCTYYIQPCVIYHETPKCSHLSNCNGTRLIEIFSSLLSLEIMIIWYICCRNCNRSSGYNKANNAKVTACIYSNGSMILLVGGTAQTFG